MARVRAVIRGRVQGVWFRGTTQSEALRLGLSGWVRNRADGSVEVAFEGPPEDVERALAWAHIGPPAAVVDEVEAVWETPLGEAGFSVR